jgi:hypothetical protein
VKHCRTISSLLAPLLLAAALPLFAQDAPTDERSSARTPRAPWFLGISAGVISSMHSGGFSFPEECAECGRYGDGAGVGPAFDLRLSIPLAAWLRLEPRMFGECRRGSFTSDPIQTVIIGRDLKPQDLLLEDELDHALRLIGFDVMAAVQIGQSGIAVLAGPSFGFRVTETTVITERILSPGGAVFVDGSREHTTHDGDTEKARGMHAGIRAGLAYRLPLGRDLALGVEATWLLPLQTVSEGDDWTSSGIRGLVTMLFVI